MASAKLAKTTVNQSQTVMARMNPVGASPWPARAWTNRAVVRREPTYTVNMTGLRSWLWGASFRKASHTARFTNGGSKSGRFFCLCLFMAMLAWQIALAADQGQMFRDGTQGQGREKGQGAHHQDHAD